MVVQDGRSYVQRNVDATVGSTYIFFLIINPHTFTSLITIEDPKNIVEELKKVFNVMHVVVTERGELVVFQLKNVSRTWFDQ